VKDFLDNKDDSVGSKYADMLNIQENEELVACDFTALNYAAEQFPTQVSLSIKYNQVSLLLIYELIVDL
jgi:hypothetical protein